ncbi:MAG: glycosyl transferase family protein [Pseudonocardiales bacterium]|nr:glycosyl transferase family protein [Pseudonocardiales bacterium]
MPEPAFDDLLELYRWRFGIENPSILDWTGSMRVRPQITDAPVRDERPNAPARNTVIFGPLGDRLRHPDLGVQVVVIGANPSAIRLAEARRVARDAILVWSLDDTATVEWRRSVPERRPKVSLLVVSADAPGQLQACLHSLTDTTPTTPAVEVLVVDANPTAIGAAAARDCAERFHTRYATADPARGRVGAINPGAEAARGELIVVIDENVRLLAGWLRPLIRPLDVDVEVGVVGGKLIADDETVLHAGGGILSDATVVDFAHETTVPASSAPLDVRDVFWVSGRLMATRRGLLRRLGGIDPLVGPTFGDVDYCLRVRAAGRRVVHQPQTVAALRRPTVVEGVDGPTGDSGSWFVRRWSRAS